MTSPPSPTETARRRSALRVLEIATALILLVRAGSGWQQLLTPRRSVPAPPPLEVDLVHASAADLTALPGIGPVRAAAIVRARHAAGPFTRLEDLLRVKGIGPVTIRRLSEAREVRVAVDGRPAERAGR